MTRTGRGLWVATLAWALLIAPAPASAATIFIDIGMSAADIADTVDLFRAALGDPNNGTNAGPLDQGRREINWDGGGNPNGTVSGPTLDAFQNRGVIFTTPGTGFAQAPVGGPTDPATDDFFDIYGVDYSNTFAAFSPVRLFAPIGSNVTEATFSIPDSNGAVPATVSGFGAVFSDVDISPATTIQLFDRFGNEIETLQVPAVMGSQTFAFAGIVLDPGEPGIASLRIVTGTNALGVPDNPSGGIDVVAMDDFLFAEPQQIVPGPAALLLVGAGGALLAVARRRSRDRRAPLA